MALLDVIKYDGENNRDWLIYKYPKSDFTLGSQLIVNQSQIALFYKAGEVADVFEAGTYTLKTGNLPLLNRLVQSSVWEAIPFFSRSIFCQSCFTTGYELGNGEIHGHGRSSLWNHRTYSKLWEIWRSSGRCPSVCYTDGGGNA